MRLTTIARMDVGDGTVSRYEVQVTRSGAPDLPLSFDQNRHCELGRRTGSWMALAFESPFPATREQIAAAWMAVIDRHGTLRTAVTDAGGPPRLEQIDVRPGHWSEVAADGDPREALRREFDVACDPFAAPSHRLCLVEPRGGGRPSIVVGLDHCHVDAWSLLVLLRDLTACLDDVVKGRGVGAGLPAAPAFGEHTAELAGRPIAPADARRRWAQIMDAGGGEMPVFPLPLGDVSTPRGEVVVVRDVLDSTGVERLETAGLAGGVRMLPIALAEMTRASVDLGGTSMRAVFPTHSRRGPADDPNRWHDSMGWFITNSVIECDSPDPADCARDVADAVALGAHALEPILAPYGGMPHTPGMFAISWLDNRKLPVDVDLSLRPQHVSAAIRTTGVMVWFVVGASGLHLRCRYPDTPEARESVGRWVDDVCAGLRARATVRATAGPGPASSVAV